MKGTVLQDQLHTEGIRKCGGSTDFKTKIYRLYWRRHLNKILNSDFKEFHPPLCVWNLYMLKVVNNTTRYKKNVYSIY